MVFLVSRVLYGTMCLGRIKQVVDKLKLILRQAQDERLFPTIFDLTVRGELVESQEYTLLTKC